MSRHEKKRQLVVYKGGKCQDCAGIFPDCCYDFDHLDPATKAFTISARMALSLEELQSEADKCDLVCANCHRIRATIPSGMAAAKAKGRVCGRPRMDVDMDDVRQRQNAGESLRSIAKDLKVSPALLVKRLKD